MLIDVEILILLVYVPTAGVIYFLDLHFGSNDKETSGMKALFLACLAAPLLILFNARMNFFGSFEGSTTNRLSRVSM